MSQQESNTFILIFSDFLVAENSFYLQIHYFAKHKCKTKCTLVLLRSPSEPGWQHFFVFRSNLHFDLSTIQVGINWLSRRHSHAGFNFKNVMILSSSLSLLSFFWLVVVSIPYLDLLCC